MLLPPVLIILTFLPFYSLPRWLGRVILYVQCNFMLQKLVFTVSMICHSCFWSLTDFNLLCCSLFTDLHLHDTPLKLRLWSFGITCVWQLGQVPSVLDQSETEHWAPYSPCWEILCNVSRRHRTGLAGIVFMYIFDCLAHTCTFPWHATVQVKTQVPVF